MKGNSKLIEKCENIILSLAKENLEGFECVTILVKCISWMCAVSENPLERFKDIHDMLDDYEEQHNIMGLDDLFGDSKNSGSMDST